MSCCIKEAKRVPGTLETLGTLGTPGTPGTPGLPRPTINLGWLKPWDVYHLSTAGFRNHPQYLLPRNKCSFGFTKSNPRSLIRSLPLAHLSQCSKSVMSLVLILVENRTPIVDQFVGLNINYKLQRGTTYQWNIPTECSTPPFPTLISTNPIVFSQNILQGDAPAVIGWFISH